MAVEQFIKKGDDALKSKDYLGAIDSYSKAIKENPQAFTAFLKRSTAYQKLKNGDNAKKDISSAFTIASERGRRSEIGLCYFKLGLIYYQEKKIKLALAQFEKAKEYDCKELTLDMWKNKAEYDLKTHPELNVEDDEDADEEQINFDSIVEDDSNYAQSCDKPEPKPEPKIVELKNDEESESKPTSTAKPTAKPQEETPKSSNIDVLNKIAPLNVKIRDDWYQSNEEVIITIYAKKINEDKLTVDFDSKSVSISFPSAANSEYNYHLDPLYAEIIPAESKYKVYSTKLEITLKKKEANKWAGLEAEAQEEDNTTTTGESSKKEQSSGIAYPTSSRKKVNWNNFKVDDDDKDEGDTNAFFQKIFKDVDEDSRRAMMKSYIQSNGTVLTTSWDEAKDKEFETSPPEGMQAKKWGT